jgi:hypothetical protein
VTSLIASVASFIAGSAKATSSCTSGAVFADVALLITGVAGRSFFRRAINSFVAGIATLSDVSRLAKSGE